VRRQSHVNWEHLVLDGASTDLTAVIVRRYQDSRMRFVSEPDNGIYDAMNKGLLAATGEVVGFLNSDDLYADEHSLGRIAAAFADLAVEAVFGDLVYVNGMNDRVLRYWKSRPFTPGAFAKGWSPAHPTFYVRTSVVRRVGLFDLRFRLAADTAFMSRYLECERIRSIYIPHVQVRMRVGGATSSSMRNILRQNQEIFAALRANGITYSVPIFVACKFISRCLQFARGLLRRDST